MAKPPAFDDNFSNEAFLSNGCQVTAFKNLSDYICTNSLIWEKTIPPRDQWKSRPWHLGRSMNALLCDISFHRQEHPWLCVLGANTPASPVSKRKNPLGWWFKVTPTLLYPTSVVSAKMIGFARTQHGSPSTPPTTKNMSRLIRNRCCCLSKQNVSICMSWQVYSQFGPSLMVLLQNDCL